VLSEFICGPPHLLELGPEFRDECIAFNGANWG
jgi:hypothetical protein